MPAGNASLPRADRWLDRQLDEVRTLASIRLSEAEVDTLAEDLRQSTAPDTWILAREAELLTRSHLQAVRWEIVRGHPLVALIEGYLQLERAVTACLPDPLAFSWPPEYGRLFYLHAIWHRTVANHHDPRGAVSEVVFRLVAGQPALAEGLRRIESAEFQTDIAATLYPLLRDADEAGGRLLPTEQEWAHALGQVRGLAAKWAASLIRENPDWQHDIDAAAVSVYAAADLSQAHLLARALDGNLRIFPRRIAERATATFKRDLGNVTARDEHGRTIEISLRDDHVDTRHDANPEAAAWVQEVSQSAGLSATEQETIDALTMADGRSEAAKRLGMSVQGLGKRIAKLKSKLQLADEDVGRWSTYPPARPTSKKSSDR
jgi:hypothetical protein